MTKRTIRKTFDKIKFLDYKKVAENFCSGALLAKDYEYWNAAGVLFVHASIAYADAITIKVGGVKCQGEDHLQVIKLLKELLASSGENNKALVHLEKIIVHKTAVSYSGDVYGEKDIENIWKNFDRFRSWAITQLND